MSMSRDIPRRNKTWRFELHHLYFLLAAFQLLTISVALWLSHSVLQINKESAEFHEQWAEQITKFVNLTELAAAVNDPGNEVFTSHNIEEESRRLEQAVATFRKFSQALHEDIDSSFELQNVEPLQYRLNQINQQITSTENDAKKVFEYLAAGDEKQASARMAIMDQHFGGVFSSVNQMCQKARAIQLQHSSVQSTRAQLLKHFQYTTLAGALMVVCAAALYGFGLARSITASDGNLALFSAIVESSDDAIIGMSLEGSITAWNHGAERLFGYTSREILGEPVKTLVPRDRLEEKDYLLETTDHSQGVRHFDTVRRHKDGNPIDVSLTISPVYNIAGEIKGLSKIARDITERKQAEQQLLDSEARSKGVLEAAADAIISIDQNGRIESFNPAAERMFAYQAKETIGRNIRMLMPEPYSSEHDGYLAKYLNTGEKRIIGINRETVGLRQDGTTLPIELSVSEVQQENRKLFIGIVRDITKRKSVESKATSFGHMLDSSQNEIFIFDAETLLFMHVNQGAQENLGYTMEELSKLRPTDIKPEYSESLFAEVIKPLQIGEQESLEFQTRHIRKDGSLYPVEVHLQLSEFQGVPAYIAMISDITERIKIEEERNEYLDMVEQSRAEIELQAVKLEIQTYDLEKARETAEQASRTKSDFLANMSHELRTPMNSIIGFTHRLIKKLGSSLEEQHLDALQTIDRNSRHLLGLINDVLDLSKIEAGRMELKRSEFDLAQAVQDVASQTSSLTDVKPVKLVLDLPEEPVIINADRIKMVQVITNLVSNGIKYTNRGIVTVSVRENRDAEGGPVARIDVKDSGVGIKDDDLDRLFKKFSQLDSSTTRPVGGTGLGLFITSQYVEMHGGTIEVESEYGKGSTFSILLPLKPDELSEDAVESSPQDVVVASIDRSAKPSEKKTNILCVDDDVDTVKLISNLLSEQGASVHAALNGEEALEALLDWTPDVIVLDLIMPVMDGFAFLDRIQDHPIWRTIPVVVLSVMTLSDEEMARIKPLCSTIVTKGKDELTQTVHAILHSASKESSRETNLVGSGNTL